MMCYFLILDVPVETCPANMAPLASPPTPPLVPRTHLWTTMSYSRVLSQVIINKSFSTLHQGHTGCNSINLDDKLVGKNLIKLC